MSNSKKGWKDAKRIIKILINKKIKNRNVEPWHGCSKT